MYLYIYYAMTINFVFIECMGIVKEIHNLGKVLCGLRNTQLGQSFVWFVTGKGR